MSFDNPTPLRVGARGTLLGWTVTVAGRVVLGVELGGERYYWNEFNLIDASGHSGTLVYEETEDGPEWKLFELLVPRKPLTVAEAERKRVGDTISLGGEAIPITLVDRSRVYFIEGTAPEGVEVGDLADFLNADGGEHMYVVSWTGEEIEFYEGRDVTGETVATAFGLARGAPAFTGRARLASEEDEEETSADSGATATVSNRFLKGIVAVVLAVFGFSSLYSCFPSLGSWWSKTETALRKQAAPSLRLANGASGTLGERAYTVGAHALVEIGRVAGRFERHEYQLTAEAASGALLVNGLTGGTRQWHLLLPVVPPANFGPYDAAKRLKGQQLSLQGTTATITELFQSRTRSIDGQTAAPLLPGGVQYGFVATSGGAWWLARWNENRLTLYRGTPLDEKSVLLALGPGPEKPK